MKDKKVISRKNLPSRLPIGSTMFYLLCLDYFQAPQWLWGVTCTILVVVWIGTIIDLIREESTDIFNEYEQ